MGPQPFFNPALVAVGTQSRQMHNIYTQLKGLILLWAIAAASLAPIVGQAALTQLDITYCADYSVDVSISHHSETVYASALTASYMPGARNGPQSDPLPGPSSFTAFSLDVRYHLISESYWQSETLPANNDNPPPEHQSPAWKPGGIYRAASLYDAYVGQVNSSTAEGRLTGAALQLAIWDVLYGDAKAVNHDDSGFFIETGKGGGRSESELVLAANAMLASAANVENPNSRDTFWDAVLGPNGRQPLSHNQDLLGPTFSTSVVPESSTVYAAGGAMAYFLLTSLWQRRK